MNASSMAAAGCPTDLVGLIVVLRDLVPEVQWELHIDHLRQPQPQDRDTAWVYT